MRFERTFPWRILLPDPVDWVTLGKWASIPALSSQDCSLAFMWLLVLKWTPVPSYSRQEEAFIFCNSLLNVLSFFKHICFKNLKPVYICSVIIHIVELDWKIIFFHEEESKASSQGILDFEKAHICQALSVFTDKDFFCLFWWMWEIRYLS